MVWLNFNFRLRLFEHKLSHVTALAVCFLPVGVHTERNTKQCSALISLELDQGRHDSIYWTEQIEKGIIG